MNAENKDATFSYQEGNYATVSVEELYDRQLAHDDLRIIDRFIEYKKDSKDEVAYLTYILKKREDDGPWEKWIKVVKLCKVYNIPKELREKKALMVSQDELLHAVWAKQINFLTVYCNMPDGKASDVKGFYYCYGVQVTEPIQVETDYYNSRNTEEEKMALTLKHLKEQADADFGGLIRLLRGTYRQSQFLGLNIKEAEAIRRTMENAPNLQVIRGIPKTHISSASGVTTSLNGVTTTPEGIEQNEEFIRGLLHDRYANVVMAFPIPEQELLQWSTNVAQELSRYKSQYSGMISHNAGISIPMIFAGNLSAAAGNTSGVTDTSGETLGVTNGNSDSYSHNVGDSQSVSHNLGYSQGQSVGVADSVSQAHTNSASQGISNSQSLSNSIGASQTDSIGHTHGITDTSGVSRSHSIGSSETLSEGKSFSESRSRSIGESFSQSHSLGNTFGVSNTHSTGESFGTSNSFGLSQGITEGQTRGTTFGQTAGYTHGITEGITEGQTTGTTRGETIGQTRGQTIGNTFGHTTGTTIGNTISDSTSHSTGGSQTLSHGNSFTNSNGTSTNHGISNSYNTGHNIGISDGTSHSDTMSQTHSETNGTTDSKSGGYTWGDNDSRSHSKNSSTTTGVAFNGGVDLGAVRAGATINTSGSEGTGEGFSQGTTFGGSASRSLSHSNSISDGWSRGTSDGTSHTINNGLSFGRGMSITDGTGTSQSTSHGVTSTLANGTSWSDGSSHSIGRTNSVSDSFSNSRSISNSLSDSMSHSLSNSLSHSLSNSLSQSASNSFANSLSNSLSDSLSRSMSGTQSIGNTHGFSIGDSVGQTRSQSESFGQSHGISQSMSYGQTMGTSLSHSLGRSVSDGISETQSRGISDSISNSQSNGISRSQSTGSSVGSTSGLSQGQSSGIGKTANQGLSQSLSDGQGVSKGSTTGDSRGQGVSKSSSQALSNAQGLSNAHSNTLGTGQGLNFSFGPTIGVSRSYQIFDEDKGNLVKLLEEQNTRVNTAVRMGAFYVDSYILSYTPEAKKGIGLSAIQSWGGDNEISTVQVVDPDEFTQNHLQKHASVFEPCTMKESIPNIAEGYLWSTIMLTSELAALTHLPRVETGGASTVATNIPPFSVFANKQGEIYFGKQINYEDAKPHYDYSFNKKEFMHTLICGASGCGKTTSAVRVVKEVIEKYDDMKVFVLDWKKSWRVLKNFAPNGMADFDFYGLDYSSIRPIHMNVYVPPKYLGISQWTSKVHESLCLGYGLGNKMLSVLDKAAKIEFFLHKVLELDDNGVPKETLDAKENVYNVTLAGVYRVINAMKSYDKRAGGIIDTTLRNELAGLGERERDLVNRWFGEAGRGMQDAFDSILSKIEPYFSGELKELYCCTDKDKCVRINDLIDGKRIMVLEGGDLDSGSKKFVIQTISSGVFFYSSMKKNIEQRVEKRFFVLEEAHRIIENPDSPSGASPLGVTEDVFEIIFNEGREFGIYAMPIVQAPSHLPASIVTNCSILIIHRLGNKEDIDLMTLDLCRNGRLDNRDVPIWLAKEPIGQAIVRINNTATHQESEPVLIQVARCENEPPTNEDLIIAMDLDVPQYMKDQLKEDKYLDMDKIRLFAEQPNMEQQSKEAQSA